MARADLFERNHLLAQGRDTGVAVRLPLRGLGREVNYLKLAKIAAPALILFVVLWGAFNFGASHERRKADLEIAALQEAHTLLLTEIDRANRTALQAATEQARATERRLTTEMAALDAKYTQEITDAKTQAERDIAAVRAGELRLRNRFTCAADTASPSRGAGTAAAGTSLGDDTRQAGLQIADAEFLVRLADESDTVVRQLTACQAIVAADRQ
jgi:prophage endopeptidase